MSLTRAREVVNIEAQAVKGLLKSLDKNFLAAIDLIHKCRGRVIIAGMGKTGIIGRKIAATFSSTGTPSMWMHSAEAIHGDLGQVTGRDVVIVLSNSGETDETKRLLPIVKKIGAKIIALTGNLKSTLAKHSDVVLNVAVKKEGCPLGLAPMASATAMLVMGDCLAASLIDRKGFRKEDFAFFHPAGDLGRRLLLKVEDVMRVGHFYACVKDNVTIRDCLLAITRARCGCACIVNNHGRLTGIFTDGDLRRHLEKDPKLAYRKVQEVMTKNPLTISKDRLAAEAMAILKERKIDELPVIDKAGKSVGLLDIQDLLKVGLF